LGDKEEIERCGKTNFEEDLKMILNSFNKNVLVPKFRETFNVIDRDAYSEKIVIIEQSCEDLKTIEDAIKLMKKADKI
jgi:hypothetical protein